MVCVLNWLGLCGKLLAKNVPNWAIAVSVFLTLASALQVHCCPAGWFDWGREGSSWRWQFSVQSPAQGCLHPRVFQQTQSRETRSHGECLLTALSTKKTEGILFHYSSPFSFIHHYIATKDKQKTGRPTCKHQTMSLIKSRACLLWLWSICHF